MVSRDASVWQKSPVECPGTQSAAKDYDEERVLDCCITICLYGLSFVNGDARGNVCGDSDDSISMGPALEVSWGLSH